MVQYIWIVIEIKGIYNTHRFLVREGLSYAIRGFDDNISSSSERRR